MAALALAPELVQPRAQLAQQQITCGGTHIEGVAASGGRNGQATASRRWMAARVAGDMHCSYHGG